MSGNLVILDRDGVINHDSADFIKSTTEWQPIEGSAEAIGALTAAGFTVAVASNQSGISRELLDRRALYRIHAKMRAIVREYGGDIDKIVYCPHHPDDDCRCRKPRTGLFEDLARHYGYSLAGIPAVGDSLRDIDSALSVGARPMLVLTGNGESTNAMLQDQERRVETFSDLAAVAEVLIAEKLVR